MDIKQLEAEARFVARNAKHNLRVVRKNPDVVIEGSLDKVMADLRNMNKLHKTFEAQKKNARRSGRTSLRTRLKYLVVSILTPESHKGKGETA